MNRECATYVFPSIFSGEGILVFGLFLLAERREAEGLLRDRRDLFRHDVTLVKSALFESLFRYRERHDYIKLLPHAHNFFPEQPYEMAPDILATLELESKERLTQRPLEVKAIKPALKKRGAIRACSADAAVADPSAAERTGRCVVNSTKHICTFWTEDGPGRSATAAV
jgi:hypothetical protein